MWTYEYTGMWSILGCGHMSILGCGHMKVVYVMVKADVELVMQ